MLRRIQRNRTIINFSQAGDHHEPAIQRSLQRENEHIPVQESSKRVPNRSTSNNFDYIPWVRWSTIKSIHHNTGGKNQYNFTEFIFIIVGSSFAESRPSSAVKTGEKSQGVDSVESGVES